MWSGAAGGQVHHTLAAAPESPTDWITLGLAVFIAAVAVFIAYRVIRFQKHYRTVHPMACTMAQQNNVRIDEMDERVAGVCDSLALLSQKYPEDLIQQSLHLLQGGRASG